MNKALMVTTSALGSSKTQIWNPARPLALGHPFQWVLEKTDRGLRIREVSSLELGPQRRKPREIPYDSLKNGTEIQLEGKSPISLKIQTVTRLSPVFEAQVGDELIVYACSGSWVLSSALLGGDRKRYVGKVSERKCFTLEKESGEEVSIHCHAPRISLRLGDGTTRMLEQGESAKVSFTQLTGATLLAADAEAKHSWRFGLASIATVPATPKDPAHATPDDTERAAFVSALRYSALGFAVFLALSWFWPKPKVNTQEIIPPQYAKLLLRKPKSAGAQSASSRAVAPTEKIANSADVPKKVQNSAVVQAFRAKALSNAVNGLLKGGMSRLLAQSDFVTGSQANKEARRIFDTRSKDLKATGPETGISASKSVQVASLGGGGGAAGGVGYGKGEHAGVKGQGGSFVTMDTGGSVVEEGLTKDEVGEVIHKHLSEVRYCYESAIIRTPDIEGKLMVSFTIGGNGLVKSSEVKTSTLPDPRLDDCILRRLGTWKFPQPRGGIDVSVTYPFIFKTLGR